MLPPSAGRPRRIRTATAPSPPSVPSERADTVHSAMEVSPDVSRSTPDADVCAQPPLTKLLAIFRSELSPSRMPRV